MDEKQKNVILKDWEKHKTLRYNQKIENAKIKVHSKSEHNLGVTYNYSIEYDLVEDNIIKYFKTDIDLTSNFEKEIIMGY